MPVQDATNAIISPSADKPLVHIRTDLYSGRKYHASASLPENTDLLGPCSPYSYTIYKRFRNEVCAECWRYDRGRRTFLTRRDGEGYQDENLSGEPGDDGKPTPSDSDVRDQKDGASVIGAGLWFCDAQCQRSWIVREGIDAVSLLRRLEGARQKKTKALPVHGAQPSTASPKITHEVIEKAWSTVCEREKSPKEVKRWREQLRLDDYETDMARYVLLALLRYHRERSQPSSSKSPRSSGTDNRELETLPVLSEGEVRPGTGAANGSGGYEESSDWRTFASLQRNELALIEACPEILEHQTRIYQLLKGRFGSDGGFVSSSSVDRRCASRRGSSAASSPSGVPRGGTSTSDDRSCTDGGRAVDVGHVEGKVDANGDKEARLGDVITVENVRTILGVDPGNSFGIWEEPLMEESEGLGFAVYPVASLFNHDCSPNVRNRHREGRRTLFATTRGVEEGEELCISYLGVEVLSRVGERRKALLDGWYFTCRCERCTGEL